MKELAITVRVKNNRLLERREALGLSQPEMAKRIGIGLHTYMRLETLRSSPLSKNWAAVLSCVAPGCGGRLARPATRKLCLAHSSADAVDVLRWRAEYPVPTTWSATALAIAAFFVESCEELWPEGVLQVRAPVATKRMDAFEAAALTGEDVERRALPPDRAVEHRELSSKIADLMHRLTPREEWVLRKRFGIGVYRGNGNFSSLGGGFRGFADGDDDETARRDIGTELGISVERVRQIEAKALRKLQRPGSLRILRDL